MLVKKWFRSPYTLWGFNSSSWEMAHRKDGLPIKMEDFSMAM
jgi:hypothetical protein